MIDLPELYWFAGLFEGEGYVYLQKTGQYAAPTMGVEMANEDVISTLVTMFGGTKSTRKRGSNQRTYTWSFSASKGCIELLSVIYDLLSKKRQTQIDTVMEGYKPSPKARINAEGCEDVISKLKEGHTQTEIAKELGISQSVISKINTGKYGNSFKRKVLV